MSDRRFAAAVRIREIALALPRKSDRDELQHIADRLHAYLVSIHDTPRLRELSDLLVLVDPVVLGSASTPWTWSGGYPQRITNGAAALIAEVFEDPDSPARIASLICDAVNALAGVSQDGEA